ncbi:MAG: barstar family protein [Oscillospiraceae bacterium]
MNNTETIICDLSNCKDLTDLHKIIQDAFNFPNYYGTNLDAL